MPLRESSDNLYRMGNGYSKMLQMINFDNNGNVNINPDMNNDDINTLMSSDSNMMNMNNINNFNNINNINNINNYNNINMMGRTFYAKQKNIHSKTPIKIRIQSASNDLVNDNNSNGNNNNNINNNAEENKSYNNMNNKNTRNKKQSLPKIKNDNISVEGFEKDENNKNDPKITKIIRKSQSKGNIRQSGTKF